MGIYEFYYRNFEKGEVGMTEKDTSDVWYWYQHIEAFKQSGLYKRQYCKKHEIDIKDFQYKWIKFENSRNANPVLYAKNLELTRQYLASDIKLIPFAQQNNMDISLLRKMVTHVGYLHAIERLKADKEPSLTPHGTSPHFKGLHPMKFIPVSQKLIPTDSPVEPASEVIEKQNDLEIIISKGVKVSISPAIDSMKIIKIIELLKDL